MSSISVSLREQVAERSQYRCNYCQTQQSVVGISFTIDHIMPKSLGGPTALDNLCLACWDCNMIKGNQTDTIDAQTGMPIRLFHPNHQKWSEHFRWSENGIQLIGVTPIGQATIRTLKLNRPVLIESRRRWVIVGWHPPDFD